MYTLTHEGDKIGTTRLERGDPSVHAVSGEFVNVGGAGALAGWIKSIGGQVDDGVVFVPLNDDFELLDQEDKPIRFTEASLIAIPADDEAYLDVTGISAEDYKAYFAGHIAAMDDNS